MYVCLRLRSQSLGLPFRLCLLTAGLPFIVLPALAQEATELPGLVVETTKLRKKPANVTDTRLTGVEGTTETGGPAQDGGGPVAGGGGITGASTSVITREQIERAPQATLADIIAREAGVQITSLFGGVNGARTTVDLRGFGVAGPSNTLVLINGRRVSDWDLPSFDFSTIARDAVERIEITRGNSGAVLYGNGAVGGIINIVTRGGPGLPNEGRIEGGFGSFATREGNISVSGSSGVFSAFVNGNLIESDGYRINNELQQKSAVGDFRWTFAKGSVYLNLAADEQELGLPGERKVIPGGIDELRDDRRGTTTPLDYGDTQGARGTLGFTYMLGPGLELIVDGGIRTKAQQAGFFRLFEEAYVDTDLTTRSLTPRVDLTQPFLGLPSRVIAGIDLFDTDYESHRSMFKGLAPIHIYDGGQETLAGYWQQTVSVLPTTDVSFGGRIQRNTTTASDQFDASAPGAFGVEGVPLDRSETNHAWHVGVEHTILPGVTLLGRMAESFRVANIDERIGSALFGVPTDFDLDTQKSHDWELGVRLRYGPFQIQSSYYDMRLTDELHFDPVNFINTNLDPTRRQGVETIASWQVVRGVRLNGNLTYTDAEFRAGPNAGNDVPMVSHWTGNVGLSWDIVEKSLTLDTIVRYVGDRRMDNDQANFQPLVPDHTTVDVRLGGQIDQLFWSAAVVNLFDVEYFDYAAASTSTFGRYNAYPLAGRTFMVKAGTKW
jgi:iron complex outermembrane receptor protein